MSDISLSEDYLFHELRRTEPDYVIYAPHAEAGHDDHGNEHLHVFRAKDGNLCALWTMSEFECTHTQRPMFSSSFNGGLTWTTPQCLLRDPIDRETGKNMGSWAAAAISTSGRIYVIYNKHAGNRESHQRGRMAILCSDDCGKSWSDEAIRDLPRSQYDLDDPSQTVDWVVWQDATRLASGRVIMGYSHGWIHPRYAARPGAPWVDRQCSCEFFSLDNIDDDPAPADLRLTFLAQGDAALSAPQHADPTRRSGEEPAICELPDGRLFCVMRTVEGHIWYSVSPDGGVTWRPTEMLRFRDGGEGIRHPLSPCPMFRISEAEYVLFAHCHDGFHGTDRPQIDWNWRNPLYLLKGEFRPDAHQPVWFSEPVPFMDNGDATLTRKEISMYSSMTIDQDGTPIFWYPDRKFFLLGRRIPRTLLDQMRV